MMKQLPNPRIEVQGFFKLEAVNEETGERRLLADWFPNLILNQGLNRLGSVPANALSWAHVGTGSATPLVTDTQLQTAIAATNSTQGGTNSYIAGPPAYQSSVVTLRFATGTAAGNLTEVGIGWGSGSGSLFSRSLIKDGSGNPTTITVLSTEALDISYELRLYPPADATGTITISGTSYDYIIRPEQSGNTNWWHAGNFAYYGTQDGHQRGSHAYAFDGTIGTALQSPSGNSYAAGFISLTSAAYSNNSYKRQTTMVLNLNEANFAAGIRSVSLPYYAMTWQVQFTPAIPKTNTKVLTLVFELSWARRP